MLRRVEAQPHPAGGSTQTTALCRRIYEPLSKYRFLFLFTPARVSYRKRYDSPFLEQRRIDLLGNPGAIQMQGQCAWRATSGVVRKSPQHKE